MILKRFIQSAVLFGITTTCNATLQEKLERYVPGWIQHLTPVGNDSKTAKQDLETFESKFDVIKPIPGNRIHPALSNFYDTGLSILPLITFYGSGELNGLVFQGAIRAYGPLQLSHVESAKLYVEGILNAENLTVSELQALGDARIVHANVSGMTYVLGELGATRCVFNDKIHVKGTKAVLKKCNLLGNLQLESPQKNAPIPRLYLTEETHIQGNISCWPSCQVFLEKGSIIHGKTFNAEVRHLNQI